MNITNTALTINFTPLNDIKRIYMNNYDNLKKQFNEPTILPIPDDAPDDIPRIMCQSLYGHSNLIFSKKSLQFNTAYDNDFQQDWSKCKEYLLERFDLFADLLSNMGCHLGFSGFIAQLVFPSKEKNGTNDLLKRFSKINTCENIFDFGQKIVIVKDNKYFVNYSINNIRLFNGSVEDTPGFLSQSVENDIGVVLDINDRYDFNYNKDFEAQNSSIKEMLELISECIKNLPKLVEIGELII